MSDPSTWSGRTLGGRYQIEERLGVGGMATVYKATDPNLKRVVAVKLIHPHLATDPPIRAPLRRRSHGRCPTTPPQHRPGF
ncbi:MAG: hypothetical protein IPG51_21215 [Chloroflexi bacterium]|nr:hypothetical protein [Chloroflexota bacterium]